jgi:hypothetical protein
MTVTVESVVADLRDVAHRATEGDFEPALDTIVELARPERLARFIGCLLSHPDEPARCAPVSFFHVLGFAKFVLVNRKPDFMLRMHIWPPDDQCWPGHIHNHRDTIVSAVVCGTLEKQIFVRDPAGNRLVEYLEECTENRWTLQRVGLAALRCSQVTKLRGGSHYALTPDVLHRIKGSPDQMTVTLLLETATTLTTTAVFTTEEERPPQRLTKSPLALADYRQGLRTALDALRG